VQGFFPVTRTDMLGVEQREKGAGVIVIGFDGKPLLQSR
jgi:hypothetical protein